MDYNYGYNDAVSNASNMNDLTAGLAIVILLIVLFIALIVWIIGVIGKWKIFGKANQPKWAAFIPIYDAYILCKVVGVNPIWILIVIIGGIISGIPIIGSLLYCAITIYFGVLLAVSTARSFGKSDGFAVGLFLVQPIFHLILGFGSSEYQGAKPMDDVILNKLNSNNNNNSNTNTPAPTNNETTEAQEESKYCPYCGTKVPSDSKVCPNCGKDI